MKNETTRQLKGFEQHGVVFTKEQDANAVGHCPFCGREEKFYAHRDEGVWQCFTCSRSGNFETFLKMRADDYVAAFKGKVVRALSVDRGLKPRTLKAWNVGWSGNFYTIPLHGNTNGTTTDLKRYRIGAKALATTAGHLSLAMASDDDRDGRDVWLCEGEWDAMALWEVFHAVGNSPRVWSTPGASILPKRTVELFYDKNVVVAYDNDEPGQKGAIKVASKLEGVARSVRFVNWPPGLAEGFDVRDLYHGHDNDAEATLEALVGMVRDKPMLAQLADDLQRGRADAPVTPAAFIPPAQVKARYKKWLSMANTDCIDVMFGAVFANRIQGDPLWLLFVAPPGGMKTELLLSLSGSPQIHTTTTLTPQSLISGCNVGGGDPSLIPKLHEKVLVIKDLTTILEMNSIARDEIFGVLRDAYDGKIEKSFGNGVTRRYFSRFGVLAGVTPKIQSIGQSSATLGERFLRYNIRAASTVNKGASAIKQALRNIKQNDQMRGELVEIAAEVMRRDVHVETLPTLTDDMEDRFVYLAQWVAMLRGVVDREKYTGRVQYKPMTEIGTRLAKQLCKLAFGVSMYRGESEVSEQTYEVITAVAIDTAPDRVELIVRQLYKNEPEEYRTTKEIAAATRFPESTVRFILQDLTMLKILEREVGRTGRWRLSPDIVEIMRALRLYQSRPRRRKK